MLPIFSRWHLDRMTEPVPYEHAYQLCEEVLDAVWKVAMIAMAAMWAHIVWIHHSIGKRVDKATEHVLRSHDGRSND